MIIITITTLNESSSSSSYYKFSAKKQSMFTFSGLSKHHLVNTMIPAVENRCSEGVLVAGTYRYLLANTARVGKRLIDQ